MGEMLKGRAALITGASSGIGVAVARRFAREGATLIVAARRADRLETLATELRSHGVEVLVRPTDVTQEEQVLGLFADAEAFAPLDILVNNAGVAVHKPTLDVTLDDWRHVVDINLTAAATDSPPMTVGPGSWRESLASSLCVTPGWMIEALTPCSRPSSAMLRVMPSIPNLVTA